MNPADRRVLAAGAVCSLPSALLPISNPDLWWHLSAARRMAETGSIPRQDWLSWTHAGAAWVDFEWLSQALFGAVHSTLGLGGLFVLKLALFAAAGTAWTRGCVSTASPRR